MRCVLLCGGVGVGGWFMCVVLISFGEWGFRKRGIKRERETPMITRLLCLRVQVYVHVSTFKKGM